MKWSVLLLIAVAACSSSDDPAEVVPDAAPPDHTFRAVFISDTHIAGPDYECCQESTDQDNASIVKTSDRLREVVRRINAIEPRPDLVFVLGDVTHDAYHSTDPAYYEGRTAFSDLRDILAELEMPYHLALGNHDYAISCDSGATMSKEFTHDLFRRLFATEPYHAVDHKGWRFLLGNTQLGPTWEPGNPLCDTGKASYGQDQLAWIDEQLAEGLPSTFLSHYAYEFTQLEEEPGGANPDLLAVLTRHADNVMITLAGHTHIWLDLPDTYAFPHHLIAGTRFDADNFWVIEFDPPNRSYRILDHDKRNNVGFCADTYTYEGEPAYLQEQPAEDGDCF